MLNLSKKPFANDDTVLASDLNSIVTAIDDQGQSLTDLQTSITNQLAPIRSFTMASGGGLNLNIVGGTLRSPAGADVLCPNASLVLPDNSARFIYATDTGTFASAATLPANTLELGRVITLGGSINQLLPKPRFEIGTRYTNTQIDSLIATAQTNAIAAARPTLVVDAQQSAKFDLVLNTYTPIPYNAVAFGVWAGGTYVVPVNAPVNTLYVVEATFRAITRTPQIDTNIEIKFSLFVGASELQILGQGAGASGDQTITGSWEFTASPGQEIGVRAYLTRGSNVECAGNNSRIRIKRMS